METTFWATLYLIAGFIFASLVVKFDSKKPRPDSVEEIFIVLVVFWPAMLVVGVLLYINTLFKGYVKWLQK